MEVSVSYVAGNRIDESGIIQDLLDLWHKFRQDTRINDNVIDERGSPLAVDVLAQKVKAFVADAPVLVGFGGRARDMYGKPEWRNGFLYFNQAIFDFFFGLSCNFNQHD